MLRNLLVIAFASLVAACSSPAENPRLRLTAPDAGPPLGGNVVVEWHGDAATDAPDAGD